MADRTLHIGFNQMLYPLFYKSMLCLHDSYGMLARPGFLPLAVYK